MVVEQFRSGYLICSNSEEWLTHWIRWVLSNSGQWIWSAQGLTSWMGFQPFRSVDLICSNTRDSHPGCHSGQWIWSAQTQGAHILDAIQVSESDLLKHWRGTHYLGGCSAIQFSGSDLLKHWRNLTIYMFSHYGQWIWSTQTLALESNSPSRWVFSHSINGSDLLNLPPKHISNLVEFIFSTYNLTFSSFIICQVLII